MSSIKSAIHPAFIPFLLITMLLWCMTSSHSVAASGSWTSYTIESGLPDERITALQVDGDALWIGTWNGLARLHGGEVELFASEKEMLSPHISSISGRGDDLWVAHAGLRGTGGISHYNGKEWVHYRASENIISILRLDDRTFCGTWGSGVKELVDGEYMALSEISAQKKEHKITVLSAEQSTLWAGTKNAGAYRIDTKNADIYADEWTVFDEHSSRIINNAVTDITATPQGIWFSTWGGASLMTAAQEWVPYTAWGDRLADNFVTCVVADNEIVVFGTNNGVTFHGVEDNSWQSSRIPDGLVYNSITALGMTEDFIYIGTKKGLSVYRR